MCGAVLIDGESAGPSAGPLSTSSLMLFICSGSILLPFPSNPKSLSIKNAETAVYETHLAQLWLRGLETAAMSRLIDAMIISYIGNIPNAHPFL